MRIDDDDFALGVTAFFFGGAIGVLAAPTKPAAALMIALALLLLAAAAIWAARDADDLGDEVWNAAGRSKRVWRNVLLFFCPLGIGGLAAIAYFAAVRPQLDEAMGTDDKRPPPPG